ncbi:ribosomal RNA small subunit methyltransferase A [Rhodohalobacter sp. SW132]|uniref:16S rRNA (adenine(1518)-N(6)/adenine(1519)-N(6))- dimethyltransferase RsmA n=1 Tax=Rhodohalobacter sp. SW132 TaxID=2293433 RepID=UPI000E27FC24|nr:16S rRNA (adenine(1518)-N(6)/adenine(1519)-N(6))-dimethyltransferase RsmA [Rhodohalobacter sp. SW132]REL39042.1 ribosomal RNA small subunit methyltransferase A [Rhodohalobacter sp. SW132]
MNHQPRKKKSLGQHFLRDKHMISKIAGSIPAEPEDRVVEIGPGDGALTEQLVEVYPNLTAIEIDPVMVEHLQQTLPDLHIIKNDILKVDWSDVLSDNTRPVHVIGNLPYYITSQILFSLLHYRSHLETATLMMQKEVAERIVAEPKNKTYGILSVQTQLMCTPEILFDVPPQVFSPPPNVMSAVVQLRFNKPSLACSDDHLKTVVRMAFNQRRKKLSNALKRLNTELPADEFDFNLRAEALAPAMYEKLTARLEQLGTFEPGMA